MPQHDKGMLSQGNATLCCLWSQCLNWHLRETPSSHILLLNLKPKGALSVGLIQEDPLLPAQESSGFSVDRILGILNHGFFSFAKRGINLMLTKLKLKLRIALIWVQNRLKVQTFASSCCKFPSRSNLKVKFNTNVLEMEDGYISFVFSMSLKFQFLCYFWLVICQLIIDR